jgi:shikimate kinase
MTTPLPRPDRSIVLVGLMGAGKSTVGRRLAHRLGLAFADSDEEIENAAGRTIAEIFERFGESEFRDGERRVIARLVAGAPKVIATGGGAFMNEGTRALILAQCIAVWLDADIATLAERVSRRDTRPLVSGKDPHQVLAALAEQRNPYYAQAHIHVRSETVPHDRAVEQILAALARRSET